jgi:replicative superfamily II helicase
MSFSIEHSLSIAASLQVEPIPNFISQAKAKQLLQEVHELPKNFPGFTKDLDDRVTFVAYRMLSAGCSLVEQGRLGEGHLQLHSAGDLLESIHRTSARTESISGFHCLIGAMAFYACGHYSRAYVLIKATETITPVAGIIACFLRKDFSELISRLNDVFLRKQVIDEDDYIESDMRTLDLLIARSIAFVLEHSISGEAELLTNADAIMADAMIISEAGANPSFWWIARILRLMFNEYDQGSLWTCLPPFFGPEGKSAISDYASLLALAKPPVTELWRSQLSSLELALNDENFGGVVNLRTSAGKTRVAELAILKELRSDPTTKVLYLAPFRSLAFELERTFGKYLEALGFSISHLYGGSRFSGIDREIVLEANLLIATPEKTKAMLSAAPELFDSVKLIVVDEGHLLGGNERNVRNELFLEHLRILSRNHGARILLLSAVLPNAAELATWIGGVESALAQSDWKPSDERFGVLRWTNAGVQIEWRSESRCFNPDFVDFRQVFEFGKKKARKFPKSKTEAVAATAVRLSEIGPVLIFTGQAQWVPSMAKAVMLALQGKEKAHMWPDKEWRIFEAVCSEELGPDCIELDAARLGVVCHSNRLPPQVRIAIENLMAVGNPLVIVATTTLGQGVNIRVSSVIVSQTLIGKNTRITKRDFWNICGRAGRAYVDGEGKVLFAIDGTKAGWKIRQEMKLAKKYLDILKIEKVESGLLQVIRILKQIAQETDVTFETFLELVANGDYESLNDKADTVRALTDLVDDQLLALHVEQKGADLSGDQIDWIECAFQGSLAVIQAEAMDNEDSASVLSLLKARTMAILKDVPDASARLAIISSSLPLSVGKLAYRDLEFFRHCTDAYLASDQNDTAIAFLVSEFEDWARINAPSICGSIASKELLDLVRPQWLRGKSLLAIRESCEDDSLKICTEFYGYELSWLFHAVAQKLDPEAEKARRDALSLVSLLLEFGLPNEAAAKVFLAGIRSRASAVELGLFVVDSTASPKRIRNALINPETVGKLRSLISPETANWLDLLAKYQTSSTQEMPSFSNFKLQVPSEITSLHSRKLPERDTMFLCSTDGRFVFQVKSTEDLPFQDVSNDPRFIFLRTGDLWRLHCRDPRLHTQTISFDD